VLAEAQVDGVNCLGYLCLGYLCLGALGVFSAHLSGWFWNASGKTWSRSWRLGTRLTNICSFDKAQPARVKTEVAGQT